MYIKSSNMGSTSEKKHCDINVTKTAIVDKGKSSVFDVEITGGWSIRQSRNQKVIDQIFHFSVFFCLIILTCYIIAIHSLVYYETNDTANLRNKVDYAFTLHEQMKNTIESLEYTVAELKSELEATKRSCDNHVRQRRSLSDPKNSSVARKKSRRTIENVAIQFSPLYPLDYERNPMGGIVGPWIADRDAVGRNEESFGVTYKLRGRQIQISRGGLYFVYSQVMYTPVARHTTGYYSINLIPAGSNATDELSNVIIATCSVDLRHAIYDVSCYTSIVRVLRPNDIIYMQQVTNDTNINFLEDSTYFGLILLSES